MSAKYTNQYGTIVIDNEVISRISGLAATDCFGIVGMAAKNVKDGFVQLLKRESITKGIRLEFVGDALHIDFHIIVEYGTNISTIAEVLVSNVKYCVEEFVGVPVEKINIFVEDVRVDA